METVIQSHLWHLPHLSETTFQTLTSLHDLKMDEMGSPISCFALPHPQDFLNSFGTSSRTLSDGDEDRMLGLCPPEITTYLRLITKAPLLGTRQVAMGLLIPMGATGAPDTSGSKLYHP